MEATADQYNPDYVIATAQGAIPYIIDAGKPYLRKPRLVYLDDFLYKDSYYDQGGVLPLKDYIASETDVYLAARDVPSTLKSKRGNYKLTKEIYDEVSLRMSVTVRPDYKTGSLTAHGHEIFQPKDLAEFNQLVEKKAVLFSTEFINKLTEQGNILVIKDGILRSESICDGNNEYVKYMYSIKEINAFTYISDTNYKILQEYFEMLKGKSE